MSSIKQNKKLGLALGSGGVRGLAHIGVIKSLEKHGVRIDCLSGSSAGSWVAAYYALFGEVENLEKDFSENFKNKFSLLLDPSRSGGVVSGQKFYNFLQKSFLGKTFAALKKPLRILATDLVSGEPYVFKSGDLATAVRASSAVPVVFKPLVIDDKLLVDGGLSNPVPASLLKEMGVDVIIGVDVYHKNEFIRKKFSLAQIAGRSTRIAIYNLAKKNMSVCDIKINLDISKYVHSSVMSMNKQTVLEIIEIGEKGADKEIANIKQLLN